MIDKTTAIFSLRPNAHWSMVDNGELNWVDTTQTQPTEAEIQAEVTRLQAEYDSQEYARLRQNDYPSIQECVHAMLDGDLDELQVRRQEVKERFPK